jgi:cardiolipin synthase
MGEPGLLESLRRASARRQSDQAAEGRHAQGHLFADALPRRAAAPSGDVPLRVVATVPNTAGLFRIDQLVAAMAQKTLWLTDAYYAGSAAYVQALRAAARDGIDVRLLVPGASDIPLIRPLARAGYRPLLQAG